VKALVWNIRDRPTMSGSTVLGQLKADNVVTEMEQTGDWVRHDGGPTMKPGWSGKSGLEAVAK